MGEGLPLAFHPSAASLGAVSASCCALAAFTSASPLQRLPPGSLLCQLPDAQSSRHLQVRLLAFLNFCAFTVLAFGQVRNFEAFNVALDLYS